MRSDICAFVIVLPHSAMLDTYLDDNAVSSDARESIVGGVVAMLQ